MRRFLNRKLKLTKSGVRLEGDPKHVGILVKECSLEFAKGVDTPTTQEGASCVGDGDQVGASEGRRIRRAIARVIFMAQDRPDLSSAALVVSQHVSSPTTGTSEAVKIIFRYI